MQAQASQKDENALRINREITASEVRLVGDNIPEQGVYPFSKALALAEEAGSSRAVNIVLLGVLARFLDWPEESWEDAIAASVPPKTLEINLRAFRAGMKG